MTNGIFKTWSNIGRAEWGHARAPEVMSTQSAVGFQWSLKLIDGAMENFIYVGIASMLRLNSEDFSRSGKRGYIIFWISRISYPTNGSQKHQNFI